ncbi:helix-turn-helix transcriptional regulator, partial [bacterium]|nr:helix-turn-helix transcriptional regulator [bacterium]
MTQRQREVLALAAKRLTNPEIGERLGITRDGVKWHMSEILARLDVDTREEAVDLWKRYNGLPYRLHRLARVILPTATLRWAAAGVGAAAVVTVAVVAVGLSSSGSPNATPTATSTVETGIAFSDLPPLIQGIVQAIEGGDAASLDEALHPKPAACSPPQTPGITTRGLGFGPECPPGVAAGTLTGSFVGVGDCEGGHTPPAGATAQLQQLQAERPTLKYWVRDGRDGAVSDQTVRFLIFEVARPTLRTNDARIIEVDDSGIIGINSGCAASVSEFSVTA